MGATMPQHLWCSGFDLLAKGAAKEVASTSVKQMCDLVNT
jgi:hypothetical protein